MRYTSIALIVCFLALGIVGCSKSQAPKTQVPKTEVQSTRKEQSPPPAEAQKQARELGVKPGGGESTDPPTFASVMEAQLGVPVYPGAKQQNDYTTGSDSDNNAVIVVSFTTNDSLDTVLAFYRKKLKGYKESDVKSLDGSKIGGFRRSSGSGSQLIVVEAPPSGLTKIAMTVTKSAKK